jgi:hypothetical protein
LAADAADRESWAEAGEYLEAISDDPEVAHLVERVAQAAAEAAESAEVFTTQAIPVIRPLAEVVRLSGDDPFADEGIVVDDADTDGQDVFGVVDETGTVADDVADEELFIEDAPSVGDTDPFDADVVPEVVEELTAAATDPFDEAIGDGEDPEAEQAEVESWADVMVEGRDEGGSAADTARVEPPPVEDADEKPQFESTVEPFPGTEQQEHEVIPEIAEPDLDWVAEGDDEADVESWADLVDDDEDVAAADADEPGPSATEPAAGTTEVEEPIIPQSLTQFDQPASDDVDDEPVEVAPNDVPLPTVTLARLAMEQGDVRLAEATLEGVLARDPANTEARQLLGEIRGPSHRDEGAGTPAKVAALRGWLDTIRLASERKS